MILHRPLFWIAASLLLLGSLAAGCSVDAELRRSIEVIERKWPVIRDASAPAAGVSSEAWTAASDAMTRAVTSAGELSRVE